MDVTPSVSKDRELVESYGDGVLEISGVICNTPNIVFLGPCFSSEIFEAGESNFKILREVFQIGYSPSILLYGAGINTRPKLEIEKEFVYQKNCVKEAMNASAACCPSNVLCAEDRRVAAVLFPID